MAIVMPRSFSSGALSIWSNAVYLASFAVASTLVMAAVSVVLPWSMCPIVPTFTCGLLRTNFCFAMRMCLLDDTRDRRSRCLSGCGAGLRPLHARGAGAPGLGPAPPAGPGRLGFDLV